MRADPVAVTPGETILTVGELMKSMISSGCPFESKRNRRLIGIIRSEKVLRFW